MLRSHDCVQRTVLLGWPSTLTYAGGIPQRRLRNLRHRLHREEGLMCRDDDVGECHHPCEDVIIDALLTQILKEVRPLLAIDVQSCVPNLLVLQSINKGLRVDQTTAGRVDDHHPWLHLCNRILIDEVVRAREQRGMQRDDVTCSEKLIKLDITNSQTFRLRGFQPWVLLHVMGYDITLESALQDFSNNAPNVASTDDAYPPADHVEPHLTNQAEVTAPRLRPSLRDASVQRQH
mmetsp:Transcript_131721/g.328474  ORF Transcript_131721/g.328474 Transcript_131721/m.328474 type:complete len:234 (+) Transcript_131721:125-826(+)